MTSLLRLVEGGQPLPLTLGPSTPRLRPGERPVALDLPLSSREVRETRARAHAAGLGVDAWIAIVGEYEQVAAGAAVSEIEAARRRAQSCIETDAITIAPELRDWQRLLDRRATPAPDELPTVYLPLRLASAIPPADRTDWLMSVLSAPEEAAATALLIERAATRAGVTTQMWVLSSRWHTP